MTAQRIIAATAGLALASAASAQSATVGLSASATNAAPGDTITVTLSVDYDTGGASSGVFGAPGVHGFGGDVTASGDAGLLAGVSAGSPAPNASLTSGPTAFTDAAPNLVRAAAGRGLSGGLGDDPADLLTFDVTIDPGAPNGQLTLTYEGAVVLDLGSTLTTFSTSPGVNQQSLNTATLLITVGASCVADVTTSNTNPGDAGYGSPDGNADGADLSYFVENWLGQNTAVADVTTINTNPGDANYGQPDGLVDGADLSFYVENWLSGCP